MPMTSRGLEGIVANTTRLSDVIGDKGQLIYSGYDIDELAGKVSYKEVVYLLWKGRLPNRAELESLVTLGAVNSAVFPAFDTSCAASCTVLTCSCTKHLFYWSSSTDQAGPTFAWYVGFDNGAVAAFNKGVNNYVRGVRGGS